MNTRLTEHMFIADIYTGIDIQFILIEQNETTRNTTQKLYKKS